MSILDWIKLAYGVYKDQNPKKGEFVTPPTSPWEEKILGTTYDWMTNGTPTSKALAPAAAEFGKSTMPSFTLPDYVGDMAGKNALGAQGGTSTAKMDWDGALKRMLSGGGGGAAPQTTAPDPPRLSGDDTPASPSPAAGDPFGHATAPVGSQNDPFAGWPTGGTGPHSEKEKQEFLNFAKRWGPDAVSFAASLVGGNVLLSAKALYDSLKSYIQSRSGQEPTQKLPVNDMSKLVDLAPYDPNKRYDWNAPFADREAAKINAGQSNDVANNPGDVRPEWMGGNVMPWPGDTIPMGPAGRRKFF